MARGKGRSMLAAERRATIARLAKQHGSVRVADLRRQFDVTEETIRRDLEELEKSGYLKRTYGGAVSINGTGFELPYTRRVESHKEEKNIIARHAATLVQEGETIILDASTTALWLAKHLIDRRDLTVVTNSIQIMLELAGRPGIRIICTGGNLRDRTLAFVGPLAERAIAGYYVDKVFMSGKGLTPTGGLTDSNELEVELKKAMLAAAKTRVAIIDSSKMGHRAFARIAEVTEFSEIVTDPGIDLAMAAAIREMGGNLAIAPAE
ncbi:MAG: DeoR/GlpR transcriptional regulator [Firmicutes bacterium]|nr:DeoR/GlpR transcriptional regulator [Bacillota bacterium]